MTELRRIKRLRLSGEMFARMFADGNHIHVTIVDGLPADATLLACGGDSFLGLINLLFESESFPPVPEGQPYPDLAIMAERLHTCEGSTQPECLKAEHEMTERVEEVNAARVGHR